MCSYQQDKDRAKGDEGYLQMAYRICGKDPEVLVDTALALLADGVSQFYPNDQTRQEAVVNSLDEHLNLIAYVAGLAFTAGYGRAVGDLMEERLVL